METVIPHIRRLAGQAEAEFCARLRASTEPWVTLKRDYESGLKAILDEERETYVAEVEGAVAGFLILNMHGGFVGYIQTVCVVQEYRSHGIGSRLVAFAEERIFRQSPNVFICVSSFNPQARQLYERLGYKLVGELTDYVIPGCSEIMLRKTIGPLSEFHPKEP